MKAIIATGYGSPDVLQLQEVEKPVPKDQEVLIKIHATAVNSGDWRIRSLEVPPGFGLFVRLAFGFSRPRQPILGVVLAGKVEAVGKDVKKFRAGDEVFAMDGNNMGCHAEYKTMPEDGVIALKPGNLNFEEAAAITFGGMTAINYLRERAGIKSGDKVLVNGASGAVGIAAVQVARYFGAQVTGVCSTANVEFVQSFGADKVVDYTREDFAGNGETYDIIMDNVGNAPYPRVKNSLREGGRLLAVVAGLPEMARTPWVALTSSKKVVAGPADERPEDLRFLAELAEAGQFRPAISHRYPLEQMAEAHRYVDTGHKQGNVVVTLED
ncbi:MAG: NAD(P)-dependent alcohol dehydrogenase [Phaeodactylibacter sp.]|nr:NAD(P)-dependent alcohol dehydrogenase [Phaeodactylibacter sp.]